MIFSKQPLVYLTAVLLGVASGCKKNQQTFFPQVAFEEFVYLNNPSSQPLLAPGGWVYATGGYAGLIVYRRYINGGADDFAAYDRGCPAHYNQSCGTLTVSDDGLFAECPCDGERYSLFDGSPGKGAELPLQPYRVQRNGETLVIRN